MSTYEEPERLRQVVNRLMEAQQEALDAATRALESLPPPPSGGDDFDEVGQFEENERYEAALQDVRDILVGASEDVRAILDAASAEERGVLGEGGAS